MYELKECITNVSIDRLTVIGSIIDTQAFQINIINDYNITEKLLPFSLLFISICPKPSTSLRLWSYPVFGEYGSSFSVIL